MKKFKTLKILSISLIVGIVVTLVAPVFIGNSSTEAVGDLNVIWGVPDGDPIFVVSNMVPGDMEIRVVDVINNSTSIRPVAVRGEKTSEIGNLSQALDFVISQNTTDLYGGSSATGPKTLEDFFNETILPNSVFLSNLNPSSATNYAFKVIFKEDSGNEFQGSEVIFDLIIGISTGVPAECSQITFSGDPIFGTALGDSINGTSGNDLIFGLEGGDYINGRGGDDCIVGGLGGDYLVGGSGNDVILGSEENDALRGGAGNDLLIGNDGHDSLSGQDGEDQLIGGEGDDYLNGGIGMDILRANDGKDSLYGGSENDSLDAGEGGFDFANGGSGVDSCINAEANSSCEI